MAQNAAGQYDSSEATDKAYSGGPAADCNGTGQAARAGAGRYSPFSPTGSGPPERKGEIMVTRLQAFIGLVEQYFSAGRCSRFPSPDQDWRLSLAAFNHVRSEVLKAVEPLAQSLEAAGIDAFGVRRFGNAVQSRDGLPAAEPLWLRLKTSLQGIAARSDSGATTPQREAGSADSTPPPAGKTEQGEGDGGAGSTTPAAGKTEQGEGDGDKKISELESATPPLDRDSGKWVSNKRAAELEGVETRTLADYRLQGIRNAAKTLGRDKDGRVWRRQGTQNSHPWYLRSTLRAK